MSSAIIPLDDKIFIDGIIHGWTAKQGDFELKTTVKEGQDDNNVIMVECITSSNFKLWECDVNVSGSIGDSPQIIAKQATFTNYTNTISIHFPKAFFPYTGLVFDVIGVRKYDENSAELFEKFDENMSDVKLIVEGQTLYACKKILAQYSSYFYDLFYGDDTEKIIEEHKITGTTCNIFRKFLSMLYHQEVSMTMNDFLMLAELSFRFQADHCLEQCEKYLIAHSMEDRQKMKIGRGFNFKKLYPYILSNCETADEVLELMDNKGSECFGEEVELAMYERMVDLNRGEKYEKLITFEADENPVKVVDDVPWKVELKYENDFLTATIQCNWHEFVHPWKVECLFSHPWMHGDGGKEYKVLRHDESIYEYQCDMDDDDNLRRPFGNSFNRKSINIWYRNIVGFFKQRSTAFGEIRPNLTDMVLSVGDKRFHISKQILASSSSYFYTMFYSDFTEKNQTEVELKGIDSDEFEEFLQHIYHPNRHITDNNIDGLMNLSRMYNAEKIVAKCTKMLKLAGHITEVARLKIALKFDMPELITHITSQMATTCDFQSFTEQDGFHDLPSELLGDIVKKMFPKKL